MRVYLAGPVEQHELFNRYANELREMKVAVVSTWHQNGEVAERLGTWRRFLRAQGENSENLASVLVGSTSGTVQQSMASAVALPPGFNQSFEEDVEKCKEEFDSADVVLAFLDGGSMEAGYALPSEKKLICVGTITSLLNAFFIQEAPTVATWAEAKWRVAKLLLPRLGGGLNLDFTEGA